MPSIDQLYDMLLEASRRRKYRALDFYEPYAPQAKFHELGRTKRERMLRAGNQVGKTMSAAAETAMHLTGEYPDNWKGRVFDKRPPRGWAAGESSVVVRDTMQKLLCGRPGSEEDFGTGFIPRDAFVGKPSLSRGVTDAYDTIHVRHKLSGGISSLTFKSFEQGRTKFQSDTIDFGWLDEEPPMDIYSETLTRITATGGMLYVTFTPLKGRTDLVIRFMEEMSDDRGEVVMTIYDAKHISPEEREKIIAGWPEHEREARAMGVPIMGEGRVFPFSDADIMEDAIPNYAVPPHWTRLWGFDFGSGGGAHPFAAVLQLWDRDADIIHVHAAVKSDAPLIVQHASLVKSIAGRVKVAWPHDGNERATGIATAGDTIATLYKKEGLLMLPTHATFEDGGFSTEAGILEMYNRMQTGRYKVAKHLITGDWGNEFRSYHRKDGQIVKTYDDLMSASRIAVMAKRFSTTAPLGAAGRAVSRPSGGMSQGVDFPLF